MATLVSVRLNSTFAGSPRGQTIRLRRARKQNIVESNSNCLCGMKETKRKKLEVPGVPSRQCQRRLAPRFKAVICRFTLGLCRSRRRLDGAPRAALEEILP